MRTSTYRTAVIRAPGEPIEIIDVPVVAPGPGEVRVAVAGAAVNPVDLGVARGVFHAMGLINQPAHTGLGWDFAGVITASGPGVELPRGTRVAGFVPGFDRDYGTYAEQLVVPAADVAVVPAGLDLIDAATVPLNALAAAQILDLLGDPAPGDDRLLVTGAAGAVGANVAALAPERGWQVTGLARSSDAEFVRGLGIKFRDDAELPAWDAVADGAAMQERALALVRDGGRFVGVQPAARLTPERGISVDVVVTQPDGARLAGLLARAASGQLPVRVREVLPLERAADAHRAMADGGIRGRIVIAPDPILD